MWPFKTKKEPDVVQEKTKSDTFIQKLNTEPILNYSYEFGSASKKFNNNSLLILYETVSQVNSVINYSVSKAADIPVKHVRYLGNGKTKDLGETDILKSINSPNKGVSRNAFIEDIGLQFLIQGNVPIVIKKTPGFYEPRSYQVYPAHQFYIIPQYSIDQYGTPSLSHSVFDNPITGYKYQYQDGTLHSLSLEEVIYIKDKNPRKTGKDFYYGVSRLYAATRSINVLSNIYDTINTILANKGALGFLSRTSKAGEVDVMAWNEVVDKIEKRLIREYGTTGERKPIMATHADLKWNRMDSPVNEFLPIELTQQEFSQLCNQLGGIPDVLLNSKGSSTYNNVVELKAAFYENFVMPLLSVIYDSISIGIGISKNNEWIVPDYSGIESLNVQPVDKLKFYFENKMLTKNQTLELGGLPQSTDSTFNQIENGIQDQSSGQSNN